MITYPTVFGQALSRISAAADLLRPRTFFRTLARVDTLADTTRELTATVETLRIQSEQLMTIQKLDWEKRQALTQLDRAFDAAAIDAHIAAAVDAAPIEHEPFPHVVIDEWLPPDAYQRIIDAVPPSVFFANTRDHHWSVPSGVAPAYCRLVWAFVANKIVGDMLHRALNRKFAPVVQEYVHSSFPGLPRETDLTLHPSDGRIMLRRPGYTLTPHRDPKWGFVTGLVYLAREGDNEAFGTQLYRVKDDAEAPSGSVYYVEQERCQLVRDVPFRANSMLAFLNSAGAHGASIPADAQPANLERYLYQFRLGPTPKVINRLLQAIEPDKVSRWAGAKTDRAVGY